MSLADLIIVGAGPAGMAAAATAAEAGLSVALLDEQARPGGQIYRDVDRVAPLRGVLLGRDYTEGRALTAAIGHERITHFGDAVVWQIDEGFDIAYTRAGRAAQVSGKRVLLATGALERPMPVPGWTLPGVMTAGAAQILLKQSGVVASNAVLVGTGPLLYLIAAQMCRAGIPPVAMIETQTLRDRAVAMRHLGGAIRGWRYLRKGLSLLAELRRAGVLRYTGATDIAVEGGARAEAVVFSCGGSWHRIACARVLMHHGVVPNTQAARSLEIPHDWNAEQACFSPRVDAHGRTPVAGVHIAGDGAGIGGAKVAAVSGRLAALDIACDLGTLNPEERDAKAKPLLREIARERAVRPFLDAAYPPYGPALTPPDGTVICRCEEVTAGEIRRAAGMGCIGPNQAKAFGRAGMGPCQGRYCGLTVTALLAKENDQTQDDTGYYRIRPPLKPVTLGELAAMGEDLHKKATE